MTAPDTLPALLDDLAQRHGSAPALIERSGPGTRTCTYAELLADSLATAELLAARGVRQGDMVGVWLPNWIESVVLQFAAAELGAAVVGINTRYGVHELAHLLLAAQPVGIVVPAGFHGLDFAGRLREASAQALSANAGLALPWVATLRRDSEPSELLDIGGGSWLLRSDASTRTPAVRPGHARPSDLVSYFTTSGSTGQPKLAGHDQASVVTHSLNVAAALDMRPGDVFLSALPLSGVFGFNPTMGMLSAGGCCLLVPVFAADQVAADLSAFGVTHVVGGDDLLGRLMDAAKEQPGDLSALRRGGIADFGGRMPDVIEWAQETADAEISGLYGSSELFALTAVWQPGRTLSERSRGGGRLVSPDISVRVVAPDGGELPSGQTGELQFRGYNVLARYLGDLGDRSILTPDGWFRSGDLGHLTDTPGEFVFTCRAGDALRLRGFLVEPAEIERFLAGHPSVSQAKVVGVTDASGRDHAVAYVTSRDTPPAESVTLLDYCRAHLAPFKVPSRLRVVAEFPTTTGTNGEKIRTAELRAWAAEDLGTPASEGAAP
ncbi:MAG: AMP-binding protein [Frankiales bacterium]|jgi:acyl-CoA synthetase (AMP-forming)/AMP-acid ligase II|nr:AMP-binding protein [Frankiales bacterium]